MAELQAETRPEGSTPPPPRPAVPVVAYSTPPAVNRNASLAVLFAALGFLPFVPGILAVRYAKRGLADAKADPRIGGRGKARVAGALGAFSVFAWLVIAIGIGPALGNARRSARRVQCASQLRQIAMGAMMYANANRGFVPASLDDLAAGGIVPARVFVCPECVANPARPAAATGAYGTYSYVYLGGQRRIQTVRSQHLVPLAYEPATNHADGNVNVAFFDGHVERMPAAQLAAVLQQFPPPAAPAATMPAQATQPAR